MVFVIMVALLLVWELTQLRTKTLALLKKGKEKVLSLYLTALDKLEDWVNKL
jgi:hypothetical protein